MKSLSSWPLVFFVVLALYPAFPAFDALFRAQAGRSLGDQMPGLFIFAILALALNVVVGNVGLLHLGIAAFFGIGAYTVGILTVPAYPFEMSFWIALVLGGLMAAVFGGLLGVPTLRLRGDYLALVTLGFGEVVKFSIKNLDAITAGTRSLNPVPPPSVPGVQPAAWAASYQPFYYLTLAFLAATYFVLARLERSRLGRAWIAVREDELAASCMGLNVTKLKLSAFIFAAALAGIAGGLFAAKMTSTAGPDEYDFNKSIFLLCCLILGGLGSRNGVLLGVFLLYGFDNILSPIVDSYIQARNGPPQRYVLNLGLMNLPISGQMQTFSGWRLGIFGLILILVMRFRPSGLWPSNRVRDELAHFSEGGGK
jgi:branched-chain amino acid transport system permease protein